MKEKNRAKSREMFYVTQTFKRGKTTYVAFNYIRKYKKCEKDKVVPVL
jgi:hypothetical protein